MSIATGLAVGLFVSLLLAVTLTRRSELSGPGVTLLRSLFPSWRFFETPEGQVLLLSRSVGGEAEQPFAPAIPAVRRGPFQLLFAPRVNLQLACHDLVDALVHDLAERGHISLAEAEQLVSYRLVQHMVEWQLRARGRAPVAYQMKLLSLDTSGTNEELLVSPVYPCR